MADGLPDAPRPEEASEARPRELWARDWFSHQNYLDIHYSHMERLLEEQVVLRDRTTFDEITTRGEVVEVLLRGRLECAHAVLIEVRKRLEVRRGRYNRREVRAIHYSYHAWIRGTKHQLVRYDNSHDYLPPHRHKFNLANGLEVGLEYIDLDDWPTMADVIREAVELARLAEYR